MKYARITLCFLGVALILNCVPAQGAEPLSIVERVARASKSFTGGHPLRARSDSALEEQQAQELEKIDADTQAAYAAIQPGSDEPIKRRNVKLEWLKELDAFLGRNPGSPFDADICIELGRAAILRSAYKKAIQYYAQAWDQTKNQQDNVSSTMAREAAGELARLLAATGRNDDLEALEAEARQLGFPTAGHGWWWALEVKAFARKHPTDAYKCGIYSLERLARLTTERNAYKVPDIMENDSSPAGFSAKELVQIASRAGVPINSVFVTDWMRLPLPAVLHLVSEHYVTVYEKRGDFFKIQDSIFGSVRWLILPELTEEASGCILISQNQVGALGTRVLSPSEADTFRGRCHFSEPGDGPGVVPDPLPDPEQDDFPPGIFGDYPSGNCCGMPSVQVADPTLSAWVIDRPLVYKPAYGPTVHLTIAHSIREVASQITLQYRFGAYVGEFFKASWLIWAELDTTGNSAEVILPDSSRAYFEFNGTNTSTINYKWNSTLEKIYSGTNLTSLVLHEKHGRTITYGHKYSSGDNFVFHVTNEADKAGNTTTFAYDSSHYLTNVVAADSVSFQVQYGYRPSGVLMPDMVTNVVASYGANVAFEHGQQVDSEGTPYDIMLSGITDPVGIYSRFKYDSRITMYQVVTPYGRTTISQNQIAGGPNTGIFDRTLKITHPSGENEFWALMNTDTVGDWPVFDGTQTPSGTAVGTLDTTERHDRNTFHWTIDQWNPSWDVSSTNDYNWTAFSKARIRHWLTAEYPQSTHFDTLSWEQSPGIGGGTNQGAVKWYDYSNKTNSNEVGAQIMPAEFSRTMPDGTTTYKVITRNSLGKPTLQIEKWVDGGTTKYRTNSYTYSADGIDLLEHRFDPSGVNRLIVGYGYDVSHPHIPVRITNALSEITYQTYDTSHRLVTVTTPSGMVSSNTFGGDGFVSSAVTYDGSTPISTNSYTWQNGLLRTHTDPRGLIVTNSYDYLNRPTRIDFPDGTYIGYAYTNGAGTMLLHKTYEVDRLGNTHILEYDSMQRVFKDHDALDRVTAYGFCTCGAANYITNALGSGVEEVTRHVFDDHHKITENYRPDGTSTTNVYDALDRLWIVKDAFGSTTNTYDNLNRLVAVSNYFGQVSLAVYDDQNRVLSQTDANGVTITNVYDDLGRLRTRTHPDGGIESWGYTANMTAATTFTNQVGKVTTYAFDGLGRKTTEVIVGVMTNTSTFGPANDLLTLTDGKSQTTTFGINLYGLTVSKKYADGNTNLVLTYDANGRLTNRNSTAKGDTKYKYDAVGNLTNVDYATSADLSIFYDALNRVTADVVAGIFTNLYTYKAGGGLWTEDGPWANDTITNLYSSGLRVGMTIEQPTGQFTNGYSFDAVYRLTNVTSHAGSFTYDYYPTNAGVTAPTHLIRKLIQPPGSYITNSFDNNAQELETQLMTSGNIELNDHAYLYNLGGQRTKQTYKDDSYVTYTYDDAGELRTAYTTNSTGTELTSQRFMYGYDAAWNMIKRTNNTTVSSYTANNLNENTTSYSYDSNGNPSSGGSFTYTFDDENRLVTAQVTGSSKTDFYYDARGRLRNRVESTWSSGHWTVISEMRTLYNGMLVVQERDSGNTPTVTYTRGIDLSGRLQSAGGIGGLLARSSVYQSGSFTNTIYYHADANGNVTYLMKTNQTSGGTYRYDPFGRNISFSGTYAGENLYRFNSKELHPNTGYYYYGYRFYDVTTQRWVNRDPIGESDGPNLFAFVLNGPVNHFDAYGLLKVISYLFDTDDSLAGIDESVIGLQFLGLYEEIEKCRCIMPGFPDIELGYDIARESSKFAPKNKTSYMFTDVNRITDWLSKISPASAKEIPVLLTKHTLHLTKDIPKERQWAVTWWNGGIILDVRTTAPFTLAHETGHSGGLADDNTQQDYIMYFRDIPTPLGDKNPTVDKPYCEAIRDLAR